MIKILKNSSTKNYRLNSKNCWACSKQFSTSSPESLKKAEQYVEETLRSRSWTDYMISNHYPKAIRSAYCTVQLFNLQMIKISDNIKQPSLGLGRLQFWKSTINKIYNRQKPNAQPISICLHDACQKHPLTKGYFDRIINTTAEQLSNRNIQTMDHLLNLCQNSQSTLIALNLELLHLEVEKQHEQLLTKLGYSIGIAMYLRRVPYGLRNYRFLVPLDIMTKYNVQPKKVWDRIQGKPSEDFLDAVSQIATHSKKAFEDSVQIYKKLSAQKKIHPQAFRAFLKGVELQQYLKKLQKWLHKGDISLPLKFFKAARNNKFYSEGKID